MRDVMKGGVMQALKDNQALQFAVISWRCLKIAKESMFQQAPIILVYQIPFDGFPG